jgi:hypothetical protein
MRDVSRGFESTLVVATTCPRCGSLLWADSGECGNCLANKISLSIDDQEALGAESASQPARIPEIQRPRGTDAALATTPADVSLLVDEEFPFDEVVELEPDDTIEVEVPQEQPPEAETLEFRPQQLSDQGEDTVEVHHEQEQPSEPEERESKPRRWPAKAAIAVFGVTVSLAILVYTEVLELPGLFETSPPPPAPAAKHQPTVATQDVATVPSAPKQPDSVGALLPKAPASGQEPSVATAPESSEPHQQAEQQPVEMVDAKPPSPARQVGPELAKASPQEPPAGSTPAPQAGPSGETSVLTGPAILGPTAAVVPPSEPPDAKPEPLSSQEPPGKSQPPPATVVDLNKALTDAVRKGRVDRAVVLLDRGADAHIVDPAGSPLLTVAARLGHESLVDLLLKRGADPNLRDRNDLTALALASEEGNGRIVEMLLNHDKRRGAADLLGACDKGKAKVVALMLDRGADINARNSDGETPLMIAAGKGHLELVEVLLTKGADATAQDSKGFTALAWAYSPTAMNVTPFRVQKEIIRLLKHHEARNPTRPAGRE